MRRVLLFIIASVCASLAHAQIDPSSALLLNNGARGASRDSGLDSGRYTVRPKNDVTSRRDDGSKGPARKAQTVSESPTTETIESTPIPTPAPVPTQSAHAVEPAESTPVPAHQKVLHESPVDRRLNILDLSVAPAYLYNNSDSSFFHRRYSTSAPAVSADANVWLTPGFSINVGYTSTLSGHINDSLDGSKNAAANHQWFTAGIRSRRFFGELGDATALVFGLDYFEYELRVASDAVLRERVRSTGARLSLEGEFNVGPRYAWTLGFSLMPKLQHREQATDIDFQSGSSVDANAVGVSIGGRWQLDMANAFFWQISHSIEKDMFSGDASISDPTTGITPSGVGVTNSFTIFKMGYSWGN